ncbi:DUF2059 domain-containing protein [Hyphomicrobium sp. NDB2Meth4]|uniref:DUF2059 domain-containing protein n=1 Tax=Hyphomicrobium sp. NDB2Meth4 TaxID=1892846 RepID=UPI00093091DF|nr:DUF2059 domain-containing protein [Hyphomicrobium sp. NDB2Meth4]
MLGCSTLRIIACLALVLIAPLAHAEDAPAPDPARIAAAKELMTVTGMTKQMDGMIAVMGEGFRKGAQDRAGSAAANALGSEFDKHMQRMMSYRDQMLEEFATIYAQRFTVDELQAVIDFYKSPTGQKFIAATPELMQAGAQIGMKYSQKALQGPASPEK